MIKDSNVNDVKYVLVHMCQNAIELNYIGDECYTPMSTIRYLLNNLNRDETMRQFGMVPDLKRDFKDLCDKELGSWIDTKEVGKVFDGYYESALKLKSSLDDICYNALLTSNNNYLVKETAKRYRALYDKVSTGCSTLLILGQFFTWAHKDYDRLNSEFVQRKKVLSTVRLLLGKVRDAESVAAFRKDVAVQIVACTEVLKDMYAKSNADDLKKEDELLAVKWSLERAAYAADNLDTIEDVADYLLCVIQDIYHYGELVTVRS